MASLATQLFNSMTRTTRRHSYLAARVGVALLLALFALSTFLEYTGPPNQDLPVWQAALLDEDEVDPFESKAAPLLQDQQLTVASARFTIAVRPPSHPADGATSLLVSSLLFGTSLTPRAPPSA